MVAKAKHPTPGLPPADEKSTEGDGPPPYPEFGRRVRGWMDRTGVNNREVGDLIGVTPEMVRRYTGGYGMPRKLPLEKLARLIGLSPAELVYGSGGDLRASERSLDPDEIALLDTYRQLGATEKKVLRARAVDLLEAFGKPTKRNPWGKGTQ